jgi:gliding motility-associated-like protein
MPNAFSPNEDGKNDEFRGSGFTEGMQNFELSIWNRWGERIFVTSDPEEGWNGRKDNSGNLIPPGVYIYRVNYVDPRGQPIVLEGFATLVR